MRSFVLLSSLPLLLGSVAAAQQKCYHVDGTELEDKFGPCNPGAEHSGCCAVNAPVGAVEMCLDNGLCMATNKAFMGTIWQRGCTDPSGKDPRCPKMCPDRTNDFDGLNSVPAWNIQMCDYGTYCCRASTDMKSCCNNSTAPHITTDFIGAFQFATSTAGLPTTTPAPSLTNTLDPTLVFATAISTGIPLSTSPSSASAPNCAKEAQRAATVGGAVGGILGAAIFGLLGVLYWLQQKEKHQRRVKEHYEAQFANFNKLREEEAAARASRRPSLWADEGEEGEARGVVGGEEKREEGFGMHVKYGGPLSP
ncbi:hypothetical protein BDV95DRAFT_488741 [Massariosphaeria phaeospora]|uniref:Mid2 domain-containing protein n=1 Tax=Massariosphaeria phaeospora TaxID=100035 RepID=A0A7C8MAN9_9PLEO|nr:hypothetical protein BDV95DRAFT_488741 [Massariosphaeria phaeospora]